MAPLLQQGLSDPEETIIYKTITSISALVQQGLLNKTIVYDLTYEAMPLLAHPNLWVRHAMISFILTLTKKLSLADVNCKIKPLVDSHFKFNINSLNDSALVMNSLYPCIPREIYDLIVNAKFSCESFFECLGQRKMMRSLPRHHFSTVPDNTLLTRLQHEGM